ncbi:MAG: hypothetical protein KME15_16530 [Drouetiella hepatica Uher 2000/2452]|uniref:Uncharacterized protein n=1 Tax=Drouetiella hepatica Uher 2000/2452 TaxID=904376 RepID=A0A951QCJ6_9CYAN|nr:hypothetical protein [Drouetiella hepatica Uher 2000/2452]
MTTAIALPFTAAPHFMQRFGTPAFVDQAIQANHERQKVLAGGVWCAQFNPDGSSKEILYGTDKCGK